MSGIFGIFNLDSEPVTDIDLKSMAATLERRGPDGTGIWHDDPVGLGHTMLWTTPESLHEQPPVVNRRGDLVITADVRLDNRDELIDVLGLHYCPAEKIGDQELVLHAFDKWGEKCPTKLLGAFAFAIWDQRNQTLFCARDHFGIRPFTYHHTPRRFFAFASEPRAILALPQTPYGINEGRIADFLITQLESIDRTSTFFDDVYRLPPAHTLTLTPDSMQLRPYWSLESETELRLSSNDEYAEAFLEVFTEAVRCRLRGAGPTGAMLSGGMDSSSIVAVARDLMAEVGTGPLHTFSVQSPEPSECAESNAIQAILTSGQYQPFTVNYEELGELLPLLTDQTWNSDEPFDNHMTLVRMVYVAAQQSGIKVILDGVDGDSVLSPGNHIAYLLRRGQWLKAYQEAVEQEDFWDGLVPTWRGLYYNARLAFVPAHIRRVRRNLFLQRSQRTFDENVHASIISPSFARRVGLTERLQTKAANSSGGFVSDPRQAHALSLDRPNLTAGLERYNRVASAAGVEPRHPFLDRRVVAYCLALPNSQKLDGGWPKLILRRAMAGRLPDSVRWRRGKQHLGWSATQALMDTMRPRMQAVIEENMDSLSKYVDVEKVREASSSYFNNGDTNKAESVYEAAHLAAWLHRHKRRRSRKTIS